MLTNMSMNFAPLATPINVGPTSLRMAKVHIINGYIKKKMSIRYHLFLWLF
ncbi:hypothetical protein Phi13:2_gp056 [Cellulophaga phage phi13:2]|uniref:Uncharacterized protein n=1 Tax=Cellulophaga phage phi13:2 TaxID=1328030 RepID=S0A2N2_9CAUD|nr:hypothetical protein Phi13:2_gp056 [Cellulophaga phage phi13:2]AGO49666.1 hypothetical protein Phi13:2_gp056 [Cellulophaga phage phi13:2]